MCVTGAWLVVRARVFAYLQTCLCVCACLRIYAFVHLSVLQDVGVPVSLIWAYGRDNTYTHHVKKGSIAVDFPSGSAKPGMAALVSAAGVHGILMVMGLAVCAPIGGMVARFGKAAFPAPLWLRLHWGIQMLGLLFAVAGLLVIFIAVSKASGGHFGTAHARLGLALLMLGAMQLCLGLARPLPGTGRRSMWAMSHRVLGWSLVLLCAVNVGLGLGLYGASKALFVGFGIAIALEALLLLYLRRLFAAPTPSDSQDERLWDPTYEDGGEDVIIVGDDPLAGGRGGDGELRDPEMASF